MLLRKAPKQPQLRTSAAFVLIASSETATAASAAAAAEEPVLSLASLVMSSVPVRDVQTAFPNMNVENLNDELSE